MTPEQMIAQYKKDADQLKAKIPYLSKQLQRELRNQKTFPFIKIIPWKTAQGNDCFIKVLFGSKHTRTEKSAGKIGLYAILKFNDGLYLFDGSTSCYQDFGKWSGGTLFKPHFFKRYAERFGLLNGFTSAMEQFVFRATRATYSKCQLTGTHGENFDIMGIFQDGIMLGTCDNQIITIRTFLTIEQLNTKQYATVHDEAFKILSNYDELSNYYRETIYAK